MRSTIHVVATGLAATRAALEAASPVARRHQTRLVLLVPQPLADAANSNPTCEVIARYDEVASAVDQRVQIRVCMTSDVTDAVRRLTPDDATVFIGGRSTWLWPSGEERLAARLRRSGRTVVFVGCNGRPARGLSNQSAAQDH